MALLKPLIYLLIIFFPILEIGKISFSNGISLSLNDIFVGLIFITLISLTLLKKIKINTKLIKYIFIFSVVGLLSLLLNLFNYEWGQIIVSFLYLLRWIAYAFVYIAIYNQSKKTKERISRLLFVAGEIILLISFLQYTFYQNLRNLYYLGWDEHLYRLFGSFFDPNFAGIFLSIFLVYVLGFVIREKKKVIKILHSIIGVLTIIAISLTYSRSALVTLFISMFTFLLIMKKKKVFLIFLIIMVLLVSFSPKVFQTEGTNLFRSASVSQRLESADTSLLIFQKNPIIGVGFNAYRYAQHKYGYLKGENWLTSHSGAGVENSYLFLLATTGIIGLIVYLILIQKTYLLSITTKDVVSKAVVTSTLLGILVSAFFVNSLFYAPIMLWMWMIIGVMENS